MNKYRVIAVKFAGVEEACAKFVDQPFTTYEAAMRARKYLSSKGYRAAVTVPAVVNATE